HLELLYLREFLEQRVEPHGRDVLAFVGHEYVIRAADERVDRRQGSSAWARTGSGHREVADLVADEGHERVDETRQPERLRAAHGIGVATQLQELRDACFRAHVV